MRNEHTLTFICYNGMNIPIETGSYGDCLTGARRYLQLARTRSKGEPIRSLHGDLVWVGGGDGVIDTPLIAGGPWRTRRLEWEIQETAGGVSDRDGWLVLTPPCTLACFTCGCDFIPDEIPPRAVQRYVICPDCQGEEVA